MWLNRTFGCIILVILAQMGCSSAGPTIVNAGEDSVWGPTGISTWVVDGRRHLVTIVRAGSKRVLLAIDVEVVARQGFRLDEMSNSGGVDGEIYREEFQLTLLRDGASSQLDNVQLRCSVTISDQAVSVNGKIFETKHGIGVVSANVVSGTTNVAAFDANWSTAKLSTRDLQFFALGHLLLRNGEEGTIELLGD